MEKIDKKKIQFIPFHLQDKKSAFIYDYIDLIDLTYQFKL